MAEHLIVAGVIGYLVVGGGEVFVEDKNAGISVIGPNGFINTNPT